MSSLPNAAFGVRSFFKTAQVQPVHHALLYDDVDDSVDFRIETEDAEVELPIEIASSNATAPVDPNIKAQLDNIIKEHWIQPILDKSQESLSINGTLYKFILDQSANETISCNNGPDDTSGMCKAIYNCPGVAWTTLQKFEKSFCVINTR